MEWLLTAPQLLSKFSELGIMENETYVVDENAALGNYYIFNFEYKSFINPIYN